MSLIVHISVFVTYKRALRNKQHTHTTQITETTVQTKNIQKGNNTKEPKEGPKNTLQKIPQNRTKGNDTETSPIIHKNPPKTKKKKILRDSSQGSGSPTESLRIVFFWFSYTKILPKPKKPRKPKKPKKPILRDSSQGSGSPKESLRIVFFGFFGFFGFLVFLFFLVFLVFLVFLIFLVFFWFFGFLTQEPPKNQEKQTKNNPERLFPGVRLPNRVPQDCFFFLGSFIFGFYGDLLCVFFVIFTLFVCF